ncbi:MULTISPECIES: transglycosylase domain-containing protein [Micrococcaceae]|jgi:membrane peptidoglycan carboxypeptidase|uniref:transglycosylase domain-containing protein n=1 Tax=Micrococcaceae TaxID=1268 RepID=UPI001F1F1473|nr:MULTISPECIES: transglycosylase domain-containing protein [Micrococcaceae]UKA73362.1 penicillin-binding protein [Arthrobacter sp. FW306-06-A]WJH26744.1 penicillin-binding protein [Pseudarthrobacter defluvii]
MSDIPPTGRWSGAGVGLQGKLLGFVAASVLAGVLVAGLLVPGAAVAGAALSGSNALFASLPAELAVEPPSQSTKVLASDGQIIATFYAENRSSVPLDEMSPYLKDAIVAIEDSRFFEHGGVDGQGILRALTRNLATGTRQGASTLTQQYVTNVINESLASSGRESEIVLNGQKEIGDKLREMKLAIALEKKFSKEQILEGYLNIVFFNRDAYGAEAAARYYFNTTAKELTLPQAALLAGLVNSPSFYDPAVNPEQSIARRNQVLGNMLAQGKIQQAEYNAAVATGPDLQLTPSRQGCAGARMGPYFCNYVARLVLNDPAYGSDVAERERRLYRGGLTITTTLDSRLQHAAQQQVDATAGPNPGKWGASLVTVQPGTGKILAMAQNTVYLPQDGKFDTQLNFNVDAKDSAGNDLNGAGGFQPGSTMKPFTFAQWLNEGKSITATVDASKRVYPIGFPWKSTCGKVSGAYSTAQKAARLDAADDLQNAEEGFYRPMPVNYGLYNSINTATFASAAQLDFCGIQKVVDALGVRSGLDSTPVNIHQLGNLLGATGVSPLNMANAYATFANDGQYCEPRALVRITQADGSELPVPGTTCREALKPDVAKGVNYVLQDVLKRGSGVYITPKIPAGIPAAAKTGTSNNNGATWVVGYTRGLATASFFGDALEGQQRAGQNVTINGKFYKGIDGYMIAGPQWANYMSQVAALYSTEAFPEPPETMLKNQPSSPPTTAARPTPSISPSR